MTFGFSTLFFFKKSILAVIDEIVASGVRTIEFVYELPHETEMNTELLHHMARLSKDGVSFSVHSPFFEVNLGSYFNEVRSFARNRIKTAIDIAAHIAADPVVVHPGYSFLRNKARDVEEKVRQNLTEDLAELDRYAEKAGVRLAIENLQMPFFFLYRLEEFHRFREQIPRLGVTLDIGHAFIAKHQERVADPEGSMLEDVEKLGVQHVFHVHLHNNRGRKDDHYFLNGEIDLARVLKGLRTLSYDGKVIIESPDVEEQGIGAVLAKLKEIVPAEL